MTHAMTTYIALLRAVNVGGTGKLPMSALTAMCERIGFSKVRTYIASGNVVVDSTLSERHVRRQLETELERYAGKSVGVLVRTSAEMANILANNPFPRAAPNYTVAIFLHTAPSRAVLHGITGVNEEEVRLGARRDLGPRGHVGPRRRGLGPRGRRRGEARRLRPRRRGVGQRRRRLVARGRLGRCSMGQSCR